MTEIPQPTPPSEITPYTELRDLEIFVRGRLNDRFTMLYHEDNRTLETIEDIRYDLPIRGVTSLFDNPDLTPEKRYF